MSTRHPLPGKAERTLVDLHFLDGTASTKGYVVVARRDDVFLGIAFAGLVDGAHLGLPDKTCVQARIRSARSPRLAAELDAATKADNVVALIQTQTTPAGAWPGMSFEKISGERASLLIGLFIEGSLATDAPAILERVSKGDLFEKLAAYAVAQAGPENCIAEEHMIAGWLWEQAASALRELKKKMVVEQAMAATQKEFETAIGSQMEVVAPHRQKLKALFQQHVQAFLLVAKSDGKIAAPYPP
jgi:hypothetical protein